MTSPIIKRYLVTLSQYQWVGLLTFFATVGLSGLVAVQPEKKPDYNAIGFLSYHRPPVIFSSTTTDIQKKGQEISKEVFASQKVMEAAAKQVNLSPHKLQKILQIKMPKNNDGGASIQVIYKHTDRKRAELIVNTVMDQIVKESQFINTSLVRETIRQINDRLPKVTEDLRNAEEKLQDYERREGASILAFQSNSLPGAIATSQQQQRQIRLQLDGVNAQIQSLESRLGLNADQAYIAQALAADPIIGQLRSQLFNIESQLELLRQDFRDEHPNIVELIHNKEALDIQLQKRATEVLGGNGVAAPLTVAKIRIDAALDPARQELARTLINSKTLRETLQQQLIGLIKTEQELRREHATLPNKQLEQARLMQEVALKKSLYDMMQKALLDAQVAIAETTGSLTISQMAKTDDVVSSYKSKPVVLAVGGLMGILLGGVVIFLLGMLGGKYYSWEEIRSALQDGNVQLLGVLPLAIAIDSKNYSSNENMPIAIQPNSPYLDFYEKLRSNIRRLGEKPVKVVILTSTTQFEGKTFSAYNLAIASARAGKRTLLIEADLRSPSAIQCLKIAIDSANSIEPLRYYGDLSECIRLIPTVENLFAIPSPGPVRQASAIIESSEMRRLLEEVRYRFDFIILDSSPLSECIDALTLEPYTDGIILVTRPGHTNAEMLTEAMEQLTESDEEINKVAPRLLGAIINGADLSVEFSNQISDEIEEIESPLLPIADSVKEVKSKQQPKRKNGAFVLSILNFNKKDN
ncbi:lipopolysaccharide biosynthesis [Oscillatoriales cyanobacterium USR001]|nr:lipopolysaccharide biosynthesis [Oscillatoriales cyanobacterium USR001]